METDFADDERRRAIDAEQPRNLLVLAAHHVLLRIAWIFKTESVIMPAFLDSIGGAGWLRGCLPVLNRVGQSVPPLLYADRLQSASQKKWPLFWTTILMAGPFLLLSAVWWHAPASEPAAWLAPFFLALYAVFFSMTGLNQLCFGTVQGKLIRAERRGRLLMISGIFGSAGAVLCAWFLLQSWLRLPGGGFERIFGLTGLGFVAAALVVLLVSEPRDHVEREPSLALRDHFRRAWHTVREDGDFRGLVAMTMLFMAGMMLFPHYQALGRVKLGCRHTDLMYWLIAQNIGVGCFSTIAGTVADRFGNRLTIRWLLAGSLLPPLLALGLANGLLPGGRDLFWLPFLLLGLTPMALKTFCNYTLELTDESQHARYLGTLKVCMAVPFILSPLLGLLVDFIGVESGGFDVVFLGAAVCLAGSVLMSFRIAEPRHR